MSIQKFHDPVAAYAELYAASLRVAGNDAFEGCYEEGKHHFIAGEGDDGGFSVYRVFKNYEGNDTIVALHFPDPAAERFCFEVEIREL